MVLAEYAVVIDPGAVELARLHARAVGELVEEER